VAVRRRGGLNRWRIRSLCGSGRGGWFGLHGGVSAGQNAGLRDQIFPTRVSPSSFDGRGNAMSPSSPNWNVPHVQCDSRIRRSTSKPPALLAHRAITEWRGECAACNARSQTSGWSHYLRVVRARCVAAGHRSLPVHNYLRGFSPGESRPC
jgi:hypothetical protein